MAGLILYFVPQPESPQGSQKQRIEEISGITHLVKNYSLLNKFTQ
ncbi:MAG: hypothetical protein U9Q69_03065 [Nanoarchaeota archaeon]|nr:hypothetical protein [Nanoarchaeota archaeon]